MNEPVSEKKFGSLAVLVFSNEDDMGVYAAREAEKVIGSAINRRGDARVMLATGNSQIKFMEQLRDRTGIDWARVTVFHMDEYIGIPATHPASFRRYIKSRLTDFVKPKAAHFIDGDASDVKAEVRRYSALLSERPMDLCCMGIGENGHLAFNDPPASFSDTELLKIVTLTEECRRQQTGEGHFPTIADVPPTAITVTIPALLSAVTIFVIAPEMRKAEAVRKALVGPIAESCPASILQRYANARLLLDNDSASSLPPDDLRMAPGR